MKPAIRVESLAKRYAIGAQRSEKYQTLRESLVDAVAAPFRRLRRVGKDAEQSGSRTEFWALRDVSFEVQPGEVVGIIGRNGAGKSTLLKILSRIVEPTTGRAEIRGRVGSLLEVGTGFHPELTGRENIFLNGAILGMSRNEIGKKFDEIVAFSEIERFLDTPVKRYSSGMYVRLAFAVAAHLEPELLIVDEVLAVGDAQFQRKCIGKMTEVGRGGQTVLFVSHNVAAIESLCDRCVLLKEGRVQAIGDTKTILAQYQDDQIVPGAGHIDLRTHRGRTSESLILMDEITLVSGGREAITSLPMGSPLDIRVKFSVEQESFRPVLGVVIKTHLGTPLFTINNRVIPGYEFECSAGSGIIVCSFDSLPLMPGSYSIDVWFGDVTHDIDVVYDAVGFDVSAADVFGSGKIPARNFGSVFFPARWKLQ